jgi:hypothetical protein
VAANWKTVDKETKDYCFMVARILKERHAELSETEGIACLATADSISPGPKKETKQKSAESNRMDDSESTESGMILCCLPTDQGIEFPSLPFSSEQANEIRRRELQRMIPKRARRIALGDQQANQYPGMCAPTSIDRSVAHEQGMTDSYDNSSTCVLRMYQQQYPHNRMATDSSATMMWGYGNLDLSNAEMPRQIPTSACTQQGIQGTQMSIQKGSYGDDELEFPIISNVSERAMLSNMMSAIHTSKQPIPHREGYRSFAEHRRWSAPECLQTPKQEKFHAMYQAQELDIADSDVVGMWLTSKVQEEE